MADTLPPEFFELADKFIALANGAVGKHGLPLVSGALTFAAARFNGHATIAMHPQSGEHRDATVSLLLDQYRDMLRGNIDEAVASKSTK